MGDKIQQGRAFDAEQSSADSLTLVPPDKNRFRKKLTAVFMFCLLVGFATSPPVYAVISQDLAQLYHWLISAVNGFSIHHVRALLTNAALITAATVVWWGALRSAIVIWKVGSGDPEAWGKIRSAYAEEGEDVLAACRSNRSSPLAQVYRTITCQNYYVVGFIVLAALMLFHPMYLVRHAPNLVALISITPALLLLGVTRMHSLLERALVESTGSEKSVIAAGGGHWVVCALLVGFLVVTGEVWSNGGASGPSLHHEPAMADVEHVLNDDLAPTLFARTTDWINMEISSRGHTSNSKSELETALMDLESPWGRENFADALRVTRASHLTEAGEIKRPTHASLEKHSGWQCASVAIRFEVCTRLEFLDSEFQFVEAVKVYFGDMASRELRDNTVGMRLNYKVIRPEDSVPQLISRS